MTARARLTAQEKKSALLAEMKAVRAQILAAAAALPAEKQAAVFLGEWTVKDLLAHLAGWDDANMEAAQALLQGRLPAFYASIDKDWKTFNALLVARLKEHGYAQTIACAEHSHRRLLAFLEEVPPPEFPKDRGVRYRGYRVTIARILQSELDDERVHLQQVGQLAKLSL
jgi:hypothetical protein